MKENIATIAHFLLWTAVLIFWLWSCWENIGFLATGIPVLVICWIASQGGSSGGNSEPRIGGPFGGDGC